ncbi:MAG: hypothetical protein IJ011_08590 [Clostridia bacterium]|nr:hypothetical protein [Clostridia bacterium]
MTVKNFAEKFGYEVLCIPSPERDILGGYTGDLLSWVMGRLGEGEAWVTIMSNINVVAVASLSDPSCIILSESVLPDEGVIERAEGQGINILRSAKSSFDVCSDIRSAI